MDIESKAKISELVMQSLKNDARQINLNHEQQRAFGIEGVQQEEIYKEALEILHHQYRNGLVIFEPTGMVTSHNILPPIQITGLGKEYLKCNEVPVYDPDEYLKEIQSSVSNIDPIIFEYLKESIRAFSRECTMSSAIALGIASEKMILLLYDSLGDALKEQSDKKELKDADGRLIFRKHHALMAMLNKKKKLLPDEIIENSDVYLSSLFHLMRLYRNELGHPSGTSVEKSVVRVFLKCFGIYLKRLYALKEFLDSKQNQL